MNKIAQSGFSLLEMMVVVTILGIVASVALPLLGNNDPQKVSVAAEETANTLRFAVSEAKRSGAYVLVDGKNTTGHLKLYFSSSSGHLTTAIIDPLTKRTHDLNVTKGTFSQNVTVTPRFRAGGSARPQLLIAPYATQFWGFDGIGGNEGTLQTNSGVLLTLDTQSVLVNIHPITGLVTLP